MEKVLNPTAIDIKNMSTADSVFSPFLLKSINTFDILVKKNFLKNFPFYLENYSTAEQNSVSITLSNFLLNKEFIVRNNNFHKKLQESIVKKYEFISTELNQQTSSKPEDYTSKKVARLANKILKQDAYKYLDKEFSEVLKDNLKLKQKQKDEIRIKKTLQKVEKIINKKIVEYILDQQKLKNFYIFAVVFPLILLKELFYLKNIKIENIKSSNIIRSLVKNLLIFWIKL